MAEFIEDFLVNVFLSGVLLRQEGKILLDRNIFRVEKLFHHTHELNKLFGYGLQSSRSS